MQACKHRFSFDRQVKQTSKLPDKETEAQEGHALFRITHPEKERIEVLGLSEKRLAIEQTMSPIQVGVSYLCA